MEEKEKDEVKVQEEVARRLRGGCKEVARLRGHCSISRRMMGFVLIIIEKDTLGAQGGGKKHAEEREAKTRPQQWITKGVDEPGEGTKPARTNAITTAGRK